MSNEFMSDLRDDDRTLIRDALAELYEQYCLTTDLTGKIRYIDRSNPYLLLSSSLFLENILDISPAPLRPHIAVVYDKLQTGKFIRSPWISSGKIIYRITAEKISTDTIVICFQESETTQPSSEPVDFEDHTLPDKRSSFFHPNDNSLLQHGNRTAEKAFAEIKELYLDYRQLQKKFHKLQRDKEHLAQVLFKTQHTASIASWEKNLNTGKFEVSEEFYHLYGISLTNKRITDKTLLSRVHPEDQQKVSDTYNDAVNQNDQVHSVVYRLVLPGGVTRTVQSSASIEYDLRGKPVRLSGITQDISNLWQALEKISSEEEEKNKLLQVHKQMLDGLVITDLNGSIFYANPAMSKLTGFRFGKLIEKKLPDIFYPDDRKVLDKKINLINRGKSLREVFRTNFSKKSNKKIPVEVTIYPLKNIGGEIQEFAVIAYDITDIIEIEEKMKLAQKRFQFIFEQFPIGIGMASLSGTITEANPEFCRILGYSADEIKTMNRSDFTAPEYLEEDRRIFQEIVLKEGYTQPYRKEFIRKDGTRIPAEVQIFLVRDDDGNPIGISGTILDLTEIVKKERQVQSLHIRYEQLFAQNRDGLLLVHKDESILAANISVAEIMQCDMDKMYRKKISDLFVEKYHPLIFSALEGNSIEIKKHSLWEVELKNEKGKRIPVELTMFPLEDLSIDEDDRIMVFVLRNVSEKKQQELLIQTQRARLESSLSASGAALFDISFPSSKDDFWSDAVYKLLGYDPEQMQVDSNQILDWFLGHVSESDKQSIQEGLKSLQDGENQGSEIIRIKQNDGSWLWVKIFGKVYHRERNRVRIAGILLDIEQEKQAERKLAESNAYRLKILNAQPNIVAISNGGRLLDANYSFFEFFNSCQTVEDFTREYQCLARLFLNKRGFLPPAEEDEEHYFLTNKIEPEKLYKVAIARDDSIYYFSFSSDYIETEEGRRTIIVLSDITELEEYRMALEKKVRVEIDKQRRQERVLLHQSRLAAMGEMISVIAHQWRQPLHIASMLTDTLEDEIPPIRENESAISYFHETIPEIQRQIHYLSHTVDDFRNFFRPDKKKIEFNISVALIEPIQLLRAQFARNNIETRFTTNAPAINIIGFPNEFKQAILNLLNNAKDAFIEKKTPKARIDIEVLQNHHSFIIRIQDNAGGIPPKVRERMFDPYFSTKSAAVGTGLGLYISKMILEDQMGARIFHCNKDGGSIFNILFEWDDLEY